MANNGSMSNHMLEISWWIGLAISTGIVLYGALTVGVSPFRPETPFDHTRSGHAEQWRFLNAASDVVPAGSTFTVQASDPDTEMSLYMMSLGLVPGSTAVPKRYYGSPVTESASARFVLTFDLDPPQADGPAHIVEVAGGHVTDRGGSRP